MADEYIKREDAVAIFSCGLTNKDHMASYHGFCIDAVTKLQKVQAADAVEKEECDYWKKKALLFEKILLKTNDSER